MIITKQSLATIAERFLETLKDEKISSLELAISSSGRRIQIREMLADYLNIFIAPSNQETIALKMSYTCPNFEGVPLEVVINPFLQYKQIIAKCSEPIPRYSLFAIDGYRNGVYFRKTTGVYWREIIEEVSELSKSGNPIISRKTQP